MPNKFGSPNTKGSGKLKKPKGGVNYGKGENPLGKKGGVKKGPGTHKIRGKGTSKPGKTNVKFTRIEGKK